MSCNCNDNNFNKIIPKIKRKLKSIKTFTNDFKKPAKKEIKILKINKK